MNALQRAEEAICNHNDLYPRTLILAYLQFCHDCGAFHPDDYLNTEDGPRGWHVLLIQAALQKLSSAEELYYPCWILSADKVLKMLEDFHADDEDDSVSSQVAYLQDFFDSMHVHMLELALGHLENLCVFHADGPEDVTEHLVSMRDGIRRLVQGWSR